MVFNGQKNDHCQWARLVLLMWQAVLVLQESRGDNKPFHSGSTCLKDNTEVTCGDELAPNNTGYPRSGPSSVSNEHSALPNI